MPDETMPRRRRRPQDAPQSTEGRADRPLRIIVSHEEDTPDWMVAAGKTSGAASRRTGRPQADDLPKTAERTQRSAAQDGRDILKMKNASPKQTESSAEKVPAKPVRRAKPAAKKPTVRKTRQAPEPVRRPKKRLSAKARARRNRLIRRNALLALCAALVVALVVGLSIGSNRLIRIKQALDRGEGVFYPNIFVNGIGLEGKTLDEAEEAVSRQVTAQVSSFRITLRTQSGQTWDITGEDLSMKYNVADQLDQLWAIGHTGTSAERYAQIKALEETPIMRNTSLSYDMSRVNQILTQVKNEVDRPAVNAVRVVDDTLWPPFTYTDDMDGQTLDITGLNETICGMVDRLESGTVDLSPTVVKASVTRKALEAQIVKLGSYETTIGKTGDYVEQRTENIRIGTERFNHLVIRPGESVSFNKVTGKRSDPKNGYQEALEIAYGEYRPGKGGGICQVSSTLYNAVVNAGLTVTKRTPHAIASSYVPYGQDATVSDDRYDFVFRNDTGADIYIEADVYKQKNYWHSRFTIYGRPDPNGYTYKLESVVRETIPLPEPTTTPDKNGEYVIYDDETAVRSKGGEGYIVDVYLVTMDANGLEVSRKLSHTDTYKARTPVYYVGVTPRETPIPTID